MKSRVLLSLYAHEEASRSKLVEEAHKREALETELAAVRAELAVVQAERDEARRLRVVLDATAEGAHQGKVMVEGELEVLRGNLSQTKGH